jgi:hypothetical protein
VTIRIKAPSKDGPSGQSGDVSRKQAAMMIDRFLAALLTAIYDAIVVLIKIGNRLRQEQDRRRDAKLMNDVEGEKP